MRNTVFNKQDRHGAFLLPVLQPVGTLLRGNPVQIEILRGDASQISRIVMVNRTGRIDGTDDRFRLQSGGPAVRSESGMFGTPVRPHGQRILHVGIAERIVVDRIKHKPWNVLNSTDPVSTEFPVS